MLVAERERADYFETVLGLIKDGKRDGKLAANWVNGEVLRRLNAENISIESAPVNAEQLAALILRLQDGTISNVGAKQAFDRLWKNPDPRVKSFNEYGGFNFLLKIVDNLILDGDLKQVTDSGAIEAVIDEVLAANPAMVEEFKAGKEKAFNALVGQAMKASKGKANPAQVNEILKKKLTS